MAAAPICNHDPAARAVHSSNPCGCWVDENGKVQRHSFRFMAGDRVRHATWKGFVGTVTDSGYVMWDKIPGIAATPSGFCANFEMTHLDESFDGTHVSPEGLVL